MAISMVWPGSAVAPELDGPGAEEPPSLGGSVWGQPIRDRMGRQAMARAIKRYRRFTLNPP
jgi:hypothetical protein